MDDYYKILGVSRNSTQEQILKAFIKKLYKCKDEKDEFNRYKSELLREAYEKLNRGYVQNEHLAMTYSLEEVISGVVCRCGNVYEKDDIVDCAVDCLFCSCSIYVV